MEDEIIKNIDKNKILEFQQNRDPFLMIDYAEEIVIGAVSYTHLTLPTKA